MLKTHTIFMFLTEIGKDLRDLIQLTICWVIVSQKFFSHVWGYSINLSTKNEIKGIVDQLIKIKVKGFNNWIIIKKLQWKACSRNSNSNNRENGLYRQLVKTWTIIKLPSCDLWLFSKIIEVDWKAVQSLIS